MTAHSIVGEWRGHYHDARSPDLSSGFTAFFLETAGRLEASIIDDFWPGKATAAGTFFYPTIQFTKVYVNQGQIANVETRDGETILRIDSYTAPIDYEGTMSEDGKTMDGTWTIKEPIFVTGTWTAHRAEAEEEKKVEEKGRRIKQPQMDEQLR